MRAAIQRAGALGRHRPGTLIGSGATIGGRSIQHGVYTAHKVLQMGLPIELAHLIITHTHGSNVRANSFEASLLYYADFADSDAGILLKGGRTFANKIHFGE